MIAGTANAWGGVALESFGIEPSVPHLFSTIGPLGAPGSEAGPGASVAWPVTINTTLIRSLPSTIQVIRFRDRVTQC